MGEDEVEEASGEDEPPTRTKPPPMKRPQTKTKSTTDEAKPSAKANVHRACGTLWPPSKIRSRSIEAWRSQSLELVFNRGKEWRFWESPRITRAGYRPSSLEYPHFLIRRASSLLGCRKKAWHLYENNRSLELMDPTLLEFDETQASRMIGVALLCIQASPTLRPPMSRVIAMLLGDTEVAPVASKPGYMTDFPCKDTSSSFMGYSTGPSTSTSENSRMTPLTNSSTVTNAERSPMKSSLPLIN